MLPRSGRKKDTVRVEADMGRGEDLGFDAHESNLRNEVEAVKAKAGSGHRFHVDMRKSASITVGQEETWATQFEPTDFVLLPET